MSSSRVVDLLETCDVELHEWPDKNVKRGNVNIECPFCMDDPSWHLGINKETGAWGCWRNLEHRGNFTQLLVQLKGISYAKASLMWKTEPAAPTRDNLVSTVIGMIAPHLPSIGMGRAAVPRVSVMKLKEGGLGARPFIDYMLARGFSTSELERLADTYGIFYAVTGEMRNRIVFEVRDRDNQLTGYVGRSIDKDATRKYHTLGHTNDMLWSEPHVHQPGRVLMVVEGIFDALRMSCHGTRDVRAVATLGATASNERIEKLRLISSLYDKVLIFPDSDVSMSAVLSLQTKLPRSGAVFDFGGAGDPGEMTRQQVIDLIETILGERDCPLESR